MMRMKTLHDQEYGCPCDSLKMREAEVFALREEVKQLKTKLRRKRNVERFLRRMPDKKRNAQTRP